MKKIGILFGQENSFPQAFIDRVNEKKVPGIMAEAVSIDMVRQGHPTDYAVIIDRISQDVPFYRAYLKNAAIAGTAVINNPFWWSADEKFFNNALALKAGVEVPKTVLLPSHARPNDTDENSFRNLKFPHNWDEIFEYIGFPAYMKPHSGGGWKSVYRVENADDLFAKHAETDQLVMMLQEEIVFTEYFRCYCLGGDNVHIMQYEPRNPHHLRYVKDAPPVDKALLAKVKDGVIRLNKALGYDFNTVEFAIRDGVPYAIDFCNPAPDADIHSVGQENFDWIVENSANMAIARAKAQKPGQLNLTWGSFVSDQIAKPATKRVTRKPAAKKPAVRKAAAASKPKAKSTPAKKAAVKTTPKRMMAKPTATPAKAKAPAKAASTRKPRATKTAANKVAAAKPVAKKATTAKPAAAKKAPSKATAAKPARKPRVTKAVSKSSASTVAKKAPTKPRAAATAKKASTAAKPARKTAPKAATSPAKKAPRTTKK